MDGVPNRPRHIATFEHQTKGGARLSAPLLIVQGARVGLGVVIVVSLLCESGHRFDGWFASLEKFSAQNDAAQVACPLCGSVRVEKQPSAPAIARSAQAREGQQIAKLQAAALALLRGASRGAENVGERFPDEARAMHYGEAATRNIRGTASVDEVRALLDEGVPVLPLPAAAVEDSH